MRRAGGATHDIDRARIGARPPHPLRLAVKGPLVRNGRVRIAAVVGAHLRILGVELSPELLDLASEELIVGLELAYAHERWGDGGDLFGREREDGLELRYGLLKLEASASGQGKGENGGKRREGGTRRAKAGKRRAYLLDVRLALSTMAGLCWGCADRQI